MARKAIDRAWVERRDPCRGAGTGAAGLWEDVAPHVDAPSAAEGKPVDNISPFRRAGGRVSRWVSSASRPLPLFWAAVLDPGEERARISPDLSGLRARSRDRLVRDFADHRFGDLSTDSPHFLQCSSDKCQSSACSGAEWARGSSEEKLPKVASPCPDSDRFRDACWARPRTKRDPWGSRAASPGDAVHRPAGFVLGESRGAKSAAGALFARHSPSRAIPTPRRGPKAVAVMGGG
jgi:hypothetical protein